MRIIDSWSQVDGGVRYLLRARDGREITLDVDDDGKASGFVRGGGCHSDEQQLVNAAARCVRAA